MEQLHTSPHVAHRDVWIRGQRPRWHATGSDYRNGVGEQHGQYNGGFKENSDLYDDIYALLSTYRPDHIFTTGEDERHPDHFATWAVVATALEDLVDATSGGVNPYRATLHTTIVHIANGPCVVQWPDAADPTVPIDEDCASTSSWSETCPGCVVAWDDRDSYIVPASMQDPNLGQNLKYRAIEAHASQADLDGGFIRRFAHRDEIFWATSYGSPPTAPVGVGDTYTVAEGATRVVGAPGVLSNDDEGTVGGAMTAVKLSDPAHGSVTVNANGSFTYTHDGSETTTDSFTYRPVQGGLDGSMATVSIAVTPVNDNPVAVDDGPYVLAQGGAVIRGAPGVLGNDSDPEGGGVTAVKVSDPAHGSVTLNANGSFTYTHDGSETTSDSFTYRAKDAGGKLSTVATVRLTIGSAVHTTGLVDVTQGRWFLYDGDGAVVNSFFFGNPGDTPVFGDWNCDGVETPGLYRQSDGFVYLRQTNTQGPADISFFFGNPGDIPLAGDFNGNGCDTISIYRPSNQTFYIINELGTDGGGLGAAEFSYVFGNPGDKPFVGDFDGDGVETVGLHRESTGLVYFRNSHSQGNADAQFIFGNPDDRLIAGDWNGDGAFSPALFRPSKVTMYFRFTNTAGNADNEFVPAQVGSTWLPISGRIG